MNYDDVINKYKLDEDKDTEVNVKFIANNNQKERKKKDISGSGSVRKIRIKELDVDLISPKEQTDYNSSKIMVIGRSGSGKSSVIKSLVYEKSHLIPVGIVFSGTEDSNHYWSSVFPDTFIINGLDDNKLQSFIKRQKIAKEHLDNPWNLCILDDCIDDAKILNKPLYHNIYKMGRHYKLLFIVASQYCMDIKPAIRTNIDATFIMRETQFNNRKSLYENYAGVIPDFNDFCHIMDHVTEDFTSLVILNSSTSNDWTDCVFWYKAKPIPPDFKFGCKDYWKFHKERYNYNYAEKY